MTSTIDLNHLRRAALALLARRDYTEHDLCKKLKDKGFAITDIQPMMVDLRQLGYMNDERYTDNYIYARRNKGFGPLRILRELQTHGISKQMIAEHLEINDNSWHIDVQRVFEKYFNGQIATEMKLRAKQMRFLQYRGFTEEQIMSVMHNK